MRIYIPTTQARCVLRLVEEGIRRPEQREDGDRDVVTGCEMVFDTLCMLCFVIQLLYLGTENTGGSRGYWSGSQVRRHSTCSSVYTKYTVNVLLKGRELKQCLSFLE